MRNFNRQCVISLQEYFCGNIFLVSFFRPWQYIFRLVLIGGRGEWKWKGTTINQALKEKIRQIKGLPSLMNSYTFGFWDEPVHVSLPDSFECLHAFLSD